MGPASSLPFLVPISFYFLNRVVIVHDGLEFAVFLYEPEF